MDSGGACEKCGAASVFRCSRCEPPPSHVAPFSRPMSINTLSLPRRRAF